VHERNGNNERECTVGLVRCRMSLNRVFGRANPHITAAAEDHATSHNAIDQCNSPDPRSGISEAPSMERQIDTRIIVALCITCTYNPSHGRFLPVALELSSLINTGPLERGKKPRCGALPFRGSVLAPLAALFMPGHDIPPLGLPAPLAPRDHQGGMYVEGMPAEMIRLHTRPTNTPARLFPLADHFS